MRKKPVLLLMVLLAMAVMPALTSASLVPEAGTTILVTTTTDELTIDGDCSLREAVRAANLNSAFDACAAGSAAASDTIVLQAGVTYLLTRAGIDDTTVNGDLDITDDVTILGSAATVNGNGATVLDRVFHILGNSVVSMSDVTIRSGRTSSFGAGIRNAGTLTLRDVTVTLNQSTGNAGGGIANEMGVLTLVDTTISSNTTSTLGGGLAMLGGSLQATNVTISSNTANTDRGGGLWVGTNASATLINCTINNNDTDTDGGGIYNENNLTLLGSTVRNNLAGDHGGGIVNLDTMTISHSTIRDNDASDSGGIHNTGGTLTMHNSTINANAVTSAGGLRNDEGGIAHLINSTVSGNTATAGAGGIANGSGAVLNLSNTTVAFNIADSDSNEFGDGGGLNNSATAVVRNSLIGENQDLSSSGTIYHDCAGGFTSDGYNLVENTTGCAIGGNTTGNITGVDPNLAALGSNGGRTQTHSFPTGAPPHNNANPGGCVDQVGAAILADQRDGARLNRCDMGSFEFAACLVIGDVDDDGDVDVVDITQVAAAWNSQATVPQLDLVVDGVIDINDIVAVTARFGLVCS